MSPARRGVAAASIAALLWGCGTVASAAVLDLGVPPGPFTFVELTSSVVFLAAAVRVTGAAVPHPSRHWRAGALGLLEPGLTYLLINAGLSRTAVTHAALIGALEPVLIALLGWALLRVAVPRRLLAPMVAVLVGSAAVVTAQAAGGDASLAGDLLVAAGVLCAAGYVVGSSRIDPGLPALGVVLLQQACALVLVVPVAAWTWWQAAPVPGGAAPTWAWLTVPVIGVGSSALTFWLYLVSLRSLPAGIAGQFLAIIPVVGFVGAVTLLGEAVSVPAVLGAVLVVVSLVVIARGERRAEVRDDRAELPDEVGATAGSWGRDSPGNRVDVDE